jgi:hypothetical protein
MMFSLNKRNQQKIYSEILFVKFWITLKLLENLTQDFGIIYYTYTTKLNFIHVPSPLLVSFSRFSFYRIPLPSCSYNSSDHLMVMEKLGENLECVKLPLVFG